LISSHFNACTKAVFDLKVKAPQKPLGSFREASELLIILSGMVSEMFSFTQKLEASDLTFAHTAFMARKVES
jgi:hypothetical protein